MKALYNDLKLFISDVKSQDFAFLMACGYLIFSYLRPQMLYPVLDFLPWTQICILLGLGYQIIKNQFRFKFGHFLMILFCIVVVFSCFNSKYPTHSFKNIDVIFIWLVEVIFFTNCIRNPTQLKLIIILFFLILFKMSFFGARTWVSRGFGFRDWGIAGPTGFFANSGEFSLLMVMYALMGIGFLAGFKDKKKIYHLIVITSTMTVLGASSRGGQLALIIGLVYSALIFKKISIKYIIYGSLIATLGYKLMPEEQLDRFSTMGEDRTSTFRLAYWEAGLDMMNKHKLTGVGFYSFPYYYRDHYKDRIRSNGEIFVSKGMEVAHNSFVEVGSTLGYSGLIIYLWILFYSFRLNKRVMKMRKDLKEGLFWLSTTAKGINASLIAYMIGSIFMSVAFYPFVYIILMFSIALYNIAKESCDEKPKNKYNIFSNKEIKSELT